MLKMKKLLSIVAAILFAATTFAQVDEVTLTTIGNGRTEDEATLRALRNALEQTFGTFVSANTSIINDELVRDEIAATSKGNVKSYQKLSVVKLPDRTTTVTLKATVSINKLISYARNNGSRAEFAGQTYAMNVKLLKLQQQNAYKTLDIMRDNVIALCHGVFDYDIKLGTMSKYNAFYFPPDMLKRVDDYYRGSHLTHDIIACTNKQCKYSSMYCLPITLDVYSTDVTTNIYTIYNETMKAIELSRSMAEEFDRNGLDRTGDYLPVKQSKIYEIDNAIANAILQDFWKVKLRKINDTEYFSFQGYGNNFSVCMLEKIKGFADECRESDIFSPDWNVWLVSNKNPIIIDYVNAACDPTNGIALLSEWPYGIKKLITSNTVGGNPKWNTKIDGQIYQQKLCSFDLEILLTDNELERFQGLELVGVSSPKHTTTPQPRPQASTQKNSKQELTKGYKKMSDLPLNSHVQISQIRILTTGLPKKTYTISMTRKDPSTGTQTYKINVSEKKQECLYWEFNGDVFASAVANARERKKGNGYIFFDLIKDNYTIKKFPKELSDFVYVK